MKNTFGISDIYKIFRNIILFNVKTIFYIIKNNILYIHIYSHKI